MLIGYFLYSVLFFRAKNRHYELDFSPVFWIWLVQQGQTGEAYCIEKVGGESGKTVVKDRRKDLAPGLLSAMIRQLGLDRCDFR